MLKAVLARWCRVRFSLAGAVFAVSLAGFGQAAQAGDNDKAAAKAHYETGTRLYDIREYDKALLEYKSAYLAQPDPAFLFNIGQCYRKLGQNAEALNFFQQYLKKAPPNDPNRRQVEARLRDIENEARLKAGAAETAPAPLTPVPNLPPPAPAPAPASPPATPALPPAAAAVEEAAPVSAAAQPSHSGRGLRIAGIACGAAGLASIATAIYYYTQATSLSDRVSNSQTPKASDDQAGRDAETMQWVFYGVGAGALATGALLYWLGWPSTDTGRSLAGVTPMVGPGVAGISAQGVF